MKFAISSNRDFYAKTLPVLIPSLLRQGYTPDDIWVFVGDEDVADLTDLGTPYRVWAYRVPIRAFEWTAALAILDHFPEPDRYWCFLHDTCEAGPRFRELFEPKVCAGELMGFSPDGLNNMGLCRTAHLIEHRARFDAYRGYSGDRLIELKRKIVDEEGWLFRGTPRSLCTTYQIHHAEPDVAVYGTEGRKFEHWHEIDLYKYKSNYSGRWDYNLKL